MESQKDEGLGLLVAKPSRILRPIDLLGGGGDLRHHIFQRGVHGRDRPPRHPAIGRSHRVPVDNAGAEGDVTANGVAYDTGSLTSPKRWPARMSQTASFLAELTSTSRRWHFAGTVTAPPALVNK